MKSSGRCGNMLVVLCVLLSLTFGGCAWINEYDQSFTFTCEEGQGINFMASIHNDYREDRLFDFSCVEVKCSAKEVFCNWTEYVNDFDKPVVFMCPADMYLAGIESEHQNHQEDRRYKFQCCAAKSGKFRSCSSTDWLNDFDQLVNYTAPKKSVLTGMASYHNDHYEDRRFQMFQCVCRGGGGGGGRIKGGSE